MSKHKSTPALEWIKKNKSIFMLTQLERFLGVPSTCLNKFFQSGYMPEKWLPIIESKVNDFINPNNALIINYIDGIIEDYRKAIKKFRAVKPQLGLTIRAGQNSFDRYNGRQEQLLADIVLLYDTLHAKAPLLSGYIIIKMAPVNKNAAELMERSLERK